MTTTQERRELEAELRREIHYGNETRVQELEARLGSLDEIEIDEAVEAAEAAGDVDELGRMLCRFCAEPIDTRRAGPRDAYGELRARAHRVCSAAAGLD